MNESREGSGLPGGTLTVGLGLHEDIKRHTLFLQLLLESFRRSSEQRESTVVHREHMLGRLEELADSQSSFLRAHRESVTNGDEKNVGSVKLFDELHIHENIGVTTVINSRVHARNVEHETSRTTANFDVTIRSKAAARVVSIDHRDLTVSVVNSAALVHLLSLILRQAFVLVVEEANLEVADNFAAGLLGSENNVRRACRMIEMTVSDKAQVCVVRRLVLVVSRQLGVLQPRVDIDNSGSSLGRGIGPGNAESSVSKPSNLQIGGLHFF